MDATVDASSHALAERIRLERRARGWSLAGLAERSGVAKAAIHRIESGQASPTAVVLIKLAAAFELTLAGLFARAEYAHQDDAYEPSAVQIAPQHREQGKPPQQTRTPRFPHALQQGIEEHREQQSE